MVVKGIIKSIDVQGNTCTVRMPYFENVGNDEIVATATVSNSPGSYNGYKVNDVVWVAFENDQLECPVIIGKLYLGIEAERADPRGTLNVVDSKISRTAEIPFDTKLSRDIEPGMPKTVAPYGSLNSIANNLSTAEVNIAQNDRDYGNRFSVAFENIDGNKAAINQTATDLSSEISARIGADDELKSTLEQTAEKMVAKVSGYKKDEDGNYILDDDNNYIPEEFGWDLQSNKWTVFSQDGEILKADKDGLEVKGKITAESGYIGDFKIGTGISSEQFYTDFDTPGAASDGVYLGTDGIRLGGDFSVDDEGLVTATNIVATGTINATEGTIGKFTIGKEHDCSKISKKASGIYSEGYIDKFETDTATHGYESGVYLGTDGIKLGNNFSVDHQGNVTAKSLQIAITEIDENTNISTTTLIDANELNNRILTIKKAQASSDKSFVELRDEGIGKQIGDTLDGVFGVTGYNTTIAKDWLATVDVFAQNLTAKDARIANSLTVGDIFIADNTNGNVTIGGFDVGKTYINTTGFGNSYKTAGSKETGVYVGTDGIKLGKNFEVDDKGNVTAKSLTIVPSGLSGLGALATKDSLTASEVGARADNWMPSAADVGATTLSEVEKKGYQNSTGVVNIINGTITADYLKSKGINTNELKVGTAENPVLWANVEESGEVLLGGFKINDGKLEASTKHTEGTNNGTETISIAPSGFSLTTSSGGSVILDSSGISLGNNSFSVNSFGNLSVKSGTIGPWKLTSNGLISKMLSISKNAINIYDSYTSGDGLTISLEGYSSTSNKGQIIADANSFHISTSDSKTGFILTRKRGTEYNVSYTIKINKGKVTVTPSATISTFPRAEVINFYAGGYNDWLFPKLTFSTRLGSVVFSKGDSTSTAKSYDFEDTDYDFVSLTDFNYSTYKDANKNNSIDHSMSTYDDQTSGLTYSNASIIPADENLVLGTKDAPWEQAHIKTLICDSIYYKTKLDSTNQEVAATSSYLKDQASSSCFDAGTLILMANGDSKKIEEVNIGESVMSYDTATNNFGTAIVRDTIKTNLTKNLVLLTFSDNTKIYTTTTHPFYTTEGWVSLEPNYKYNFEDLEEYCIELMQIGQKFYKANPDLKSYELIQLEKIQYRHGISPDHYVYNLDVDNTNTFFANNILCHNKGGGGLTSSELHTTGSDKFFAVMIK